MAKGHHSKRRGGTGNDLATGEGEQVVSQAVREAQAPGNLQIQGGGGVWRRKLPVAVG